MDAPELVIEQPFTQGTLRDPHALDAERLEGCGQDGDPAGQHRPALFGQAVELELVDVTGVEHGLFELGQALRRDALAAPALGEHDLAHGENRPRSADGRLPTTLAVSELDGFEFLACGDLGRAHCLRIDAAAAEPALGVAHAAHVQALHLQRFEMTPEDELRAATTDIHHQAQLRFVLEAMRHTEIDEARFLVARDDVNRMAECCLGTGDEVPCIARLAQGVGADHADAARGQVADPFAELGEAVHGACHGLLVDVVVGIEARGEAHRGAHAVEHAEALFGGLRHDHVKAVGAEVHRGEGARRIGVLFRHSDRGLLGRVAADTLACRFAPALARGQAGGR